MRTGAAIPIAQRHFTPQRADLLIGLTVKTDDDEVGIWDIDEELVEETDAACHHLAAVLRALPYSPAMSGPFPNNAKRPYGPG